MKDIPDDIAAFDVDMNLQKYSCDSLREALLGKKCAVLQQFGRMLLPGQNLRRVAKTEAVERLIAAAQARRYGFGGDEEDADESAAPILLQSDFKDCGRGYGLLSRTTGGKIVCALEAAYARKKRAADADYTRARKGATCKVPAAYGAADGGDCPTGMLEKDGCCLEAYFHKQESDALLADIDARKDINTGEKAILSGLFAAPELPRPKYANKQEEVVAGAFLTRMQTGAFQYLRAFFERTIEENAGLDDDVDGCVDQAAWYENISFTATFKWLYKLATAGAQAVYLFLKFLYSALARCGAFLKAKGQWLFGTVYLPIQSWGASLAAFIVTNPVQARMMLASVQLFRNMMCSKVAALLEEWHVFEDVDGAFARYTAAQAAAFAAASPLEKVGTITASILSAFMSSKRAKDVVGDVGTYVVSSGHLDPVNLIAGMDFAGITKSASGIVGRLGKAALVSLPGGTFLGEVFSVVTDTVGGAVGKAAADTAALVLYQHNVIECIWLVVDIFDITVCLEKMPLIQYRFKHLWSYLSALGLQRLRLTDGGPAAEARAAEEAAVDAKLKDAVPAVPWFGGKAAGGVNASAHGKASASARRRKT
jgi:hypothetical protein